MNPTMVFVPTRPFTFFQLLRSQLLLLLLLLGLFIGTVNVSTLLSSTSLALCNRLDSRAEPPHTTFTFTHTTTTYCRFHFACAVHNFAAMMTIILESVSPTRGCPPPHGHRVPGHAGGLPKAGGPVEMAHLASKQTEKTHLPFSLLLLTHFHTHTLQLTTFNVFH